MLYSLLYLMTPIYLCHLLSLLTQTRLKESHVFLFFILSISTILLLVGGGGGGTVYASSILIFYPAQQVWKHYSEHISVWC